MKFHEISRREISDFDFSTPIDACGGSDRDHAAWDTVMDTPHRHLTARRKRGGRSVDWPPEGDGGPEYQTPL